MSREVVVVDYGVGNVHSVQKALEHEGGRVSLSSDPEQVSRADRLLLPGVGAFGDGMRELGRRGLVEPIREFVKSGRPFMGICLGMQLLLGESEEFGPHQGLGFIPGKVIAIKPRSGFKVPQVGWASIAPITEAGWVTSPLQDVPVGTRFYFVHSFTAAPDDERHRLADTVYGGCRVSAAVRHENIVGFQFHPEKSGLMGLQILARFLT